MKCCNIWEEFCEEEYLLREYDHWKLLLRNRNMTLGNCVAITKKHYEKLSDLKPEEMGEFATLSRDIEGALKTIFKFDKINYLLLMMVDKHTHFHIIPRYSGCREFAGLKWIDEGWPKLPKPDKNPIPRDILKKIQNEIISKLK